jgi:hypothetical protein
MLLQALILFSAVASAEISGIVVNGQPLNLSAEKLFFSIYHRKLNRVSVICTKPGAELRIGGQKTRCAGSAAVDLKRLRFGDIVHIEERNSSGWRRLHSILTRPPDFPELQLNFDKRRYSSLLLSPFDTQNVTFGYALAFKNNEVEFFRRANSPIMRFQRHRTKSGKYFYSYFTSAGYMKKVSVYGAFRTLDENFQPLFELPALAYQGRQHLADYHDVAFFDQKLYLQAAYVEEDANDGLFSKRRIGAIIMGRTPDGKEFLLPFEQDKRLPAWGKELEGDDRFHPDVFDYLHLNSFLWDPDTEELVVSSRNQSSLMGYRPGEMQARWVFGGLGDQFSLTPEQKFSFQHHVSRLGKGEFLLFDNGNINKKSRILRLSINTEQKRLLRMVEIIPFDFYAERFGSVQHVREGLYFIGLGSRERGEYDAVLYNEKSKKIEGSVKFLGPNIRTYKSFLYLD